MSETKQENPEIIEVKIANKNGKKEEEDIKFLYETKKQPFVQKYYGPCIIC